MVLVESSIWIAAARGLMRIPDYVAPGEVAICPPVLQEVLQGARSRRLYDAWRSGLLHVRMLEDPMPLTVFEGAAELRMRCQDRGITPGAMDCLIAVCAIRNDVPLFTVDKDFAHIAKFTSLRLFERSDS